MDTNIKNYKLSRVGTTSRKILPLSDLDFYLNINHKFLNSTYHKLSPIYPRKSKTPITDLVMLFDLEEALELDKDE